MGYGDLGSFGWPLLVRAADRNADGVLPRRTEPRRQSPGWWLFAGRRGSRRCCGALRARRRWSFYLSNFADYNATYGSLGGRPIG